MFGSFHALSFFVLIVSSTTADETNQKSKEPLILTKYQGNYYYPKKAHIETKSQNLQYFYTSINDATYFCPADDDKQLETQKRVIQSSNNEEYRYCLFEKKFEKGNKKQCKNPPNPIIVRITDKENNPVPCGRESGSDAEKGKKLNGKWYKFTYEICHTSRNLDPLPKLAENIGMKETPQTESFKDVQQPPIYEFCFNEETNETIYVKHHLMYPALLKNLNLDRENLHVKISTDNYNIAELSKLEEVGKIYAQQLNDFHLPMTMQVLVPTGDLALYHWKTTTFHQINVKLQLNMLFQFWISINQHITEKLKKIFEDTQEEFIMYTGTTDGVSFLAQNEDGSPNMIYIGGNLNPPSFWWKLIYGRTSKQAVLVVMDNIPSYMLVKRHIECISGVCDMKKWFPNTPQEYLQHAQCCAVNQDTTVLKDFHLDLKLEDIQGVLELD